jgi:inosose dehydratase
LTTARPSAPDARNWLRRPTDALPGASIGTVPILWQYRDDADRAPRPTATTILDEIARLGFEGTQLGDGFPAGASLRAALAERSLRLAEVYAALPATEDGLAPGAMEIARERLRLLQDGGGDVLCVALDGSPERDRWTARADDDGAPRFTEAAWKGLAETIDRLADETLAAGHRLAFHPHGGTFIETPGEVERLVEQTNPTTVGICLDVGHYTVGGGDPVAALRAFGERITHVHLKDVDPAVLGSLARGEIGGFDAATALRVFTELGAGALDLVGCLRVLEGRGYAGWLMVEQDSSWPPASEAAAIGRRVLAHTLRRLGSGSDG